MLQCQRSVSPETGYWDFGQWASRTGIEERAARTGFWEGVSADLEVLTHDHGRVGDAWEPRPLGGRTDGRGMSPQSVGLAGRSRE